ncbi:DUF1365 domain-containing protein [Geminicoccaceae bacterium 1502E]|nr:DUF1365 domain-containing protein [Geminicoccaceae bacterium 1502E]
MTLRSCLYRGTVMHHRLRPVPHRFTYRVFSLFLDLDEVAELDRRLRLLSFERFNVASFMARDHGPRDGSPLRPWVLERLAEHGIRVTAPRIQLLCFPRLLGYVFNPLSIYFVHEGERLAALVYEVKNTFGGQHVYVAVTDGSSIDGRITVHEVDKAFHVSPFVPMRARYRFFLAVPGERLSMVIRESDQEGPLLVAGHTADRLSLTDGNLLTCLAGNFFMTLKIIAGIHVEALRLWRKGVPVQTRETREAPAAGPVSSAGSDSR